jgi:hypothetical protein
MTTPTSTPTTVWRGCFVVLLTTVAITLSGCSPSSDAHSPKGSQKPVYGRSSPTPVSDQVAPRPRARYSYVALGASWANGAHCGFCRTFVGLYADKLNAARPHLVRLTDLTENGGTTTTMLHALRRSPEVRRAVRGADIVLVSTGLNDLDETGALERVAAGTCGSSDGLRCLRAMAHRWERKFEEIADVIFRLRAGDPTALRMVTEQNVFVSEPSIVTDYGLPDDFALTGGRLITSEIRDATCRAARQHGGECVDVGLLFNGPDLDQPRDENSPESMQLVARALIDTGLRELR